MVELKIANPVAAISGAPEVAPAARHSSLDGKSVGLFWNQKAGGDEALVFVAEAIARTYKDVTFHNFTGSVGSNIRHITQKDADGIVAACDVVVGTTADCGSCTSWLVLDMIKLEKRGIPTVTITAEGFKEDAEVTAQISGLPDLPLMIIKQNLTNQTREGVRDLLTPAFDQMFSGLTASPRPQQVDAESKSFTNTEKFSGTDALEAIDAFNAAFVDRGWSDGLPLVPPTPEKVERMLAAVSMDPDEVVVDGLYPGLGLATAEKIAINGIMAGCRPEHMRILTAMTRAYEGTGMMGRTQAMSTGPNAPLVLVSGPIVQELGFNSGTCVAGPGSASHVNIVVGRALRLILMNIGQAYPGAMDMDTIGSPNKFSFCLAENLDASPWTPWNVAKGFDADTSTVSITLVYPGPDLRQPAATTPEELLDTLVTLTSGYTGVASVGRWLYGGRQDPESGKRIDERNVVLLAPDHARLMAEANWSREDVSQYLYDHSRMPFDKLYAGSFPDSKRAEKLKLARPEMAWLIDQPNTMIAAAEDPRCYEIFVVGGTGAKSQFLYGGSDVSTVAIEPRGD